MNHSPDHLLEAAASDPALAQLCDEIIGRLQAGDRVDEALLALEYPEHAEQIRRILPALGALVDLGASSIHNHSRAVSSPSHGASDPTPRVLGDYRILREIGRGGMGVVYEAEQRSLNRRVALKVLPMAAALDARQFQRFRLEAQAAACLHHNNIVPVFAIGTEGGVPFYAMQYIEGRSLADILHELRRTEGLEPEPPAPDGGAEPRLADLSTAALARSLVSGRAAAPQANTPGADSPTEGWSPKATPEVATRSAPREETGPKPAIRAATKSGSSTHSRDYCRNIASLGLQAAEALDHAHTRGILHRDIKPGNLLLDSEGRLWVTDFGLAQIQGHPGLTLSGDVLGTLRYMSPEQALAKRVVIDGRTDIYSLGVTLYELLTLRPAFDGKDRAEILRRIASDEPVPLRKLNPAVPTDLETIIRKALSKEPSERYATVKELADDLRNYLDDRPIRARRPSLLDRAAKHARRNAAAVVVAGAVLGLAVVGLTASTILIDRQRAEAVRQRQLARKAVDEMYTQVAEKWLGDQPNLTALQREFLEKALAYYRQFAQDRGSDPEAHYEVGAALERVGAIRDALGQHEQAEAAYLEAQDVFEGLSSNYPGREKYLCGLAMTFTKLGSERRALGRYAEAMTALERAVAIDEKLIKDDSNQPHAHRQHAFDTLCNLGGLQFKMGRFGKAEGTYRKSIAHIQALAANDREDPDLQGALGVGHGNLAIALGAQGRQQESVEARRRAVEILETLLAGDPIDPERRDAVASSWLNLSNSLGTSPEAIGYMQRAGEEWGRLAEEFPDRPLFRERHVLSRTNFAISLLKLNRSSEIEGVLRPAVVVAEGLVRDFPSVPGYRGRLAKALSVLGTSFGNVGRYADAKEPTLRAKDLLEKLTADYPEVPDYRRDLREHAPIMSRVADYLVTAPAAGDRDADRALMLARKAMELQPDDIMAQQSLGWALYRAGDWQNSIEALMGSMGHDPKGGDLCQWLFLAMDYRQLGDDSQARAWFGRAEEQFERYTSGIEQRRQRGEGVHPEPGMLRRARAEAAALLDVGEEPQHVSRDASTEPVTKSK